MMMNLKTELQKIKQAANLEVVTDGLQFVPGIWVNGKYLWLQNTMEKVIYDKLLAIKVKQEQIQSKISLSSVYVSNHSQKSIQVQFLAMHHFSNIGQKHLTFVSPIEKHLFHHTDHTVYLVNGYCDKADMKEYTAIPLRYAYTDRIWSSIEKGNLKYQPMSKGPAASIFTMSMIIEPHETCKMDTWSINGASKAEVLTLEKALLKKHTSISL
ncbi:hypothetical protein [Neobacillus cucumis]|uniref:hypothetical protein n=2 Tax=Neobacillus cucumis TaxID=1740721 RepID=UPI00366DAD69